MSSVNGNQNGKPRLWTFPFLLGWVAFGLIYFSFCFQPGVLRSDDFGYLRSVLGTLARGKLYTYEWLMPFGAFYSLACASIYQVSGNLYLATNGFQALCVLMLFPLLYILFAKRFAKSSAIMLSLVLATSPLFLCKESDFHACICTLDLFLIGLILFEAGKDRWFFVIALLAFSNRQNHICLLILPLWIIIEKTYHQRKLAWPLILGSGGFLVGVVGLYSIMNRTYSTQNHPIIKSSLGETVLAFLPAFLGGIFVTLAIFSVISYFTKFSGEGVFHTKKYWLMRAGVCLCLLLFIPFWPTTLIKTDTQFFGYLGWREFNQILPWLLLPCLFGLDFRRIKLHPYLALIFGYLLIASIRGIWWDYYFMEIIILSILYIRLQNFQLPKAPKWNVAIGLTLLFLLSVNITYAYLLKVQSDKQRLSVFSLEKLERAGRISVDQMTGATFGYLGWKLYDYHLAHEGKVYTDALDFMGYVKPNRVVIDTHLPWRNAYKQPLSIGSEILDSGNCSIGFRKVKYRVVDLHGQDQNQVSIPALMVLDLNHFKSPPFPLTNLEWRDFIHGSKN